MQYYTEQHPALNKPVAEFRANDLKRAAVKKANADQDVGLVLKKEGKKWFIKEVKPGSPFDRHHAGYIEAGQRIVKLNNENIEEKFTGMWEINDFIKKQSEVQVHVARR